MEKDQGIEVYVNSYLFFFNLDFSRGDMIIRKNQKKMYGGILGKAV